MNPFFRGAVPRIYQTTIEETIEGPDPRLPQGWMQLTDSVSQRPVYFHAETSRVVFSIEEIFKRSPPHQKHSCKPARKKRRVNKNAKASSSPTASQVVSSEPSAETPDRQPSTIAFNNNVVVTPNSLSQPIDLCFGEASEDDVDDEETVWEEEEKDDQLPLGMSELSALTMTQAASQVQSNQIESLTASDDEKSVNSSKDAGKEIAD
jgi:hypothetical protein